MSDIVNLNKARKKRDAAARRAEADSNRIRFGQKKETREAIGKSRAADAKRLEGHRLDGDGARSDSDPSPVNH